MLKNRKINFNRNLIPLNFKRKSDLPLLKIKKKLKN